MYNSERLIGLLRTFVSVNQASFFARRMFSIPSLSESILFHVVDEQYDTGTGPRLAEVLQAKVEEAQVVELRAWRKQIEDQLRAYLRPNQPPVMRYAHPCTSTRVLSRALTLCYVVCVCACSRLFVRPTARREVARLLQVEFAEVAAYAAGDVTEVTQDKVETAADALGVAGVSFEDEPPMHPVERNQHVTFILEWLRKRDRLVNTVVTPAMHIACLNDDAGITVEYMCTLPPLCSGWVDGPAEAVEAAAGHDAVLVANVVPLYSSSSTTGRGGALLVELGINNEARFKLDTSCTPHRLECSDEGLPIHVLRQGGGTGRQRIARLQINFSQLQEATTGDAASDGSGNGGSGERQDGATTHASELANLFASIGYVIVDLRDMSVNASKLAVPCSQTECVCSLWMRAADGFPVEKVRVVYRRFVLLVLRDSFLDSAQIHFLAERAGSAARVHNDAGADGDQGRGDDGPDDDRLIVGVEESKAGGGAASGGVESATSKAGRGGASSAAAPKNAVVVHETAQVVAEVLTHLSITAAALEAGELSDRVSDSGAPSALAIHGALSSDAQSRLLFGVSPQLRTEELKRSYRRHWETVLGYSLSDNNEAKELLLALLTEDSTTSVVPDAVAADMFMLIQQHTHHWTTLLSVAPSNLESVIRRVRRQAAMVSINFLFLPVTGNVSPTDLARIVTIAAGGSARIVLLANPHVLYCLSVTNVLGSVEVSHQSRGPAVASGWRFSKYDVLNPSTTLEHAVASTTDACSACVPREDLAPIEAGATLSEEAAALVPRVAVYTPQYPRLQKLAVQRRVAMSWTEREFEFRRRTMAARVAKGAADFLLIVAEDTAAVRTYVKEPLVAPPAADGACCVVPHPARAVTRAPGTFPAPTARPEPPPSAYPPWTSPLWMHTWGRCCCSKPSESHRLAL